MAKVWFVRREGARYVAPGGRPAIERPLADLVFKLDLGPQRLLVDESPHPEPDMPAEEPESLERVMVETDESDLQGLAFTRYQTGVYDSPYSPREVARRLGATKPRMG